MITAECYARKSNDEPGKAEHGEHPRLLDLTDD